MSPVSLLKLSTPTLIYPHHLLPKPLSPFIPYGFKIPSQKYITSINNPKAIIIFIGGFIDTITCGMYRVFANFNEKSCIKVYASFNSKILFSSWLPLLAQTHLPIFVIAHSWGANNFYKAIEHLDSPFLYYLLTLDPVGYHTPHIRYFAHLWENVYIAQKHKFLCLPNIIALIGGAWNATKMSDANIALYKMSHHLSIYQMIEISHFHQKLSEVIRL